MIRPYCSHSERLPSQDGKPMSKACSWGRQMLASNLDGNSFLAILHDDDSGTLSDSLSNRETFYLPSSSTFPKNTRSWRGELKCVDRDVEDGIDICSGEYRGYLQWSILMALTAVKGCVGIMQKLGSWLLHRREIDKMGEWKSSNSCDWYILSIWALQIRSSDLYLLRSV